MGVGLNNLPALPLRAAVNINVSIGDWLMKSRWIVCLALGFVALADTSAMAQPKGQGRGNPNAAKYGWLGNLEEGKSQARKSGKPLMVVVRCVP
jgi:hypothetical protein